MEPPGSRGHAVVQALGTGTLTTCTYAVYDPGTQELQVATAGHLPPLLSGPEQPTRYLELDPGLPLGVDSASFAETALRLQPQTTLVLCTDGLVERRDLPLEGMDRLATAVDAVVLPPQAVCDHVLATLRPPDGDHSELDDDVALLVAATPPGRLTAAPVQASHVNHSQPAAGG
jgi:serine phosphatase RsbU (regulator of sigma subunit)